MQFLYATAAGVGFLIIVLITIMSLAVPKFKIIQKLTDNLNLVTRENLTGLRVVRAYNAEKYQEAKFETANTLLNKNQLFTHRVMAMMNAGINLLMMGLGLAIYCVGAYLMNGAAAQERLGIFSEMVTYVSYSMHVVMSFMLMSMTFVMSPRVAVSAGRVAEVLNTKTQITDGDFSVSDTANAAPRPGTLEFRNVSFKYPGGADCVLRNISFSANSGETVAIIGPTGSGKTTLVNLIPRLFDVSEGQVLVDGVDVRDYKQRELRDKLGFVPQKATLFYGTIESNVSFGDSGKGNVTLDEVKRAVRIAQSADFVEALDDGYGASVSQGGANFSGGQKQRISIARAICRDPEIYVFDDSFSALDYKTDRELRRALAAETGGSTKLIIAQRIGTIKDADRIIVMDEGEVRGIGTHAELMKTCDVYREIALSQLSKEELE